jgi:hypothetical protein
MAALFMSRLVIICGLFLDVDGRAALGGQASLVESTLGVDSEATHDNLSRGVLRGGNPVEKDSQKKIGEKYSKYSKEIHEARKDIHEGMHETHKDIHEGIEKSKEEMREDAYEAHKAMEKKTRINTKSLGYTIGAV